jgi:Fe-S oxidoreductase
VRDGWRSDAVRDALDLCLACKGCKTDCPANVDMATYKAEFLAHHWKGRQWRRPRSDFALGWLPVTARLVSRLRLAGAVNAAARVPPLRRLAVAAGGLADRDIPPLAGETLRDWYARRGPRGDGLRGTVILWPDTFTNYLHPHVGQAAVRVLEAAGWRPIIPNGSLCCGLTWISTGQLKTARKVLSKTVAALAPHVRDGGYVVGLEPSCTSVFRADAPEMLPGDQDVTRLRDHTVTLAELLTEHTPGWEPPSLGPDRSASRARPVLAQVHCHQHAVLGWDADAALLRGAGVPPERLETGCCGLAGNFGFEAGHGEISRAIAEQALLPRLRDAPADAVVLADGFSCRTQIAEFGDGRHQAIHLAELLASAASPATPAAPATPASPS